MFGIAVAVAARRVANTHAFRHAIERMDPAHYLSSSYYEHWLTGIATMLVEKGLVAREELASRVPVGFPLGRPATALAPDAKPSGETARFKVGDRVSVRNHHPQGHTRCPRYLRGRHGVVVRVDRRHALPDVAAHTDRRCEQYTYCVRFEGSELWGDDAGSAEAVYVDLWESYLGPSETQKPRMSPSRARVRNPRGRRRSGPVSSP